MTDHLARLFYLGDYYYGSQVQPGLKTVQGELIDAVQTWSNEPHSKQTVQLSGRTDRRHKRPTNRNYSSQRQGLGTRLHYNSS